MEKLSVNVENGVKELVVRTGEAAYANLFTQLRTFVAKVNQEIAAIKMIREIMSRSANRLWRLTSRKTSNSPSRSLKDNPRR